jgi:hypothetical protein
MLWGLLGIAVPILIHLLRQRRPKVMPWAAMKFVRAALLKRQRQIRVESWLQVLVRCSLLALLALALAEPYFEQLGFTGRTAGATHRILVIDSTLSMGYGPAGAKALDRAKATARQIVESAQPGDAFNLARITGHSPRVIIRRPAFDASDILAEVDRLTLLEERGDLVACLRQLTPLLQQAGSATPREIVFLTDLQAETWLPSSPAMREQASQMLKDMASSARISVIDVGVENPENAAVVDLRARRPIAAPGSQIDLEIDLQNMGRTPRSGAKLEVLSEGVVRHREEVALPAGSRVTRTVRINAENGSDAAVEARISDDLLPQDNLRRLVVPLRKAVRVLVVDGSDDQPIDSKFVALALDPPSPEFTSPPSFRLQIVPQLTTLSRWADESLDGVDTIVLCDVPSLTESEVQRLEQFVRDGGGLILSLGDRARPEAYDERIGRMGTGLLAARFSNPPQSLTDDQVPWTLSQPTAGHLITRPFDGNPDAGLLTTPIFRYHTAEDLHPETQVVLRLSNGEPLMLERSFGQGRIIQVQTAFNDRWGSWVVWPSFLPMLHEMVLSSMGGRASLRERLVGEPIERTLPGTFDGTAAIILPESGRVTLTPTAAAEPRVLFDRTEQAGFYQMTFGLTSLPSERYAVNPDPRESVLAKASPDSLKTELFGGAPFQYATQWNPTQPQSEAGETSRSRIVRPLLAIVFALLIADLLLAGRRGKN